jgi:FkbM family methyltransferase
MNLFVNPVSRFTRWVIANRLLATDFSLVDAGVQDGIASRWEHFRERLVVYGFDPLEEAIEPLAARQRGNEHYFVMALGNEDGERTLNVPEITHASSFHRRADDGLANPDGLTANMRTRRVSIRRLDSLMKEGTVPRADFIKLDCEGFEPEILDGAQEFLQRSRPVGIECETSFHVSGDYPESHFVAVYHRLSPLGFRLCDLAFSRTPYRRFLERAKSLKRRIVHSTLVARPDVFNVLFYRDLAGSTPSRDEVLKQAMMFEAYGLRDSAYELLMTFAHLFPASVDIHRGADLLVQWAGRLRHLVPIRPTRI